MEKGIKGPRKKRKLSRVTTLHYFKLCYRSVLLILATFAYVRMRLEGEKFVMSEFVSKPLLTVIWAIFMVGMTLRFFPSKWESPGCQKQFGRNYNPTGSTDVKLHDNNAVVITALIWLFFNGIFGALKMTGVFDEGIMMLLCLVYSVCDMICILFFCPFQTWILKNRCCVSCRIYNWDFAMMFTPLFFVPGVYTWSLLIVAVALLLRWEILVWQYPERFSENTNEYLNCVNCTEKLCTHKKQLIQMKRELKKLAEKQAERILQKTHR
ncbi:MAG: hypothetical protein MJ171_05715 [Clostridia bacterium]|nr:hypothetical protein [Clostridia bacterium]